MVLTKSRLAKHISLELQAAEPGVPWAATARTRDRAVHHYFDVNLDILRETITEDLPRLLEALPPIELGCRRCSPGSESTSTPEDAASAAISQPMAWRSPWPERLAV
jgi:Ribonuclease HepT-like